MELSRTKKEWLPVWSDIINQPSPIGHVKRSWTRSRPSILGRTQRPENALHTSRSSSSTPWDNFCARVKNTFNLRNSMTRSLTFWRSLARHGNPITPSYPSWHLRTDEIWVIDPQDGWRLKTGGFSSTKSELMRRKAVGSFMPEVRELFSSDPTLSI